MLFVPLGTFGRTVPWANLGVLFGIDGAIEMRAPSWSLNVMVDHLMMPAACAKSS